MFDRLSAWWTLGVDPRQPIPTEVEARLQKISREWHAAVAVMDALPDHGPTSVLPWYVVIGPSGSGKSTLLANAGLGLDPVISTDADHVVVNGEFTIWVGPQAVFVEVAGPLLCDRTKDLDWRTLVWLIAHARRHLPVRGILLVKPLAEQFRQTPTETAADATLTRDRLAAFADLTSAVVPTYVVITKADLLGGFKEFFAVAERNDQVLGLTIPWPPERDPMQAVTVAYEGLLDRLGDRRLTALAATSNETAQRRLMQFPAQLRAALPYLANHLAISVRPTGDGEPTLRGVYFTGIPPTPKHQVTQTTASPVGEEEEKSLFFAVPSAMPPGTAKSATTAAPANNDQRPRPWFVQELFAHVVLPEATLTRLTTTAQQRQRRMRLTCLIILPAICILWLLWNTWSTWRGIRLIEDLRAPLTELSEVKRGSQSDKTTALLALDRLGTALHNAVAHHGTNLGAAGEVATARYERALRPLLLDACLAAMREELANMRRSGVDQPSLTAEGADLLRTYQMLGGQVDVQADLASRVLVKERRWFRAIDPPGGACEPHIAAIARQQLDLCLTVLIPAGLLRIDIDRPLVEALQRAIGGHTQLDNDRRVTP